MLAILVHLEEPGIAFSLAFQTGFLAPFVQLSLLTFRARRVPRYPNTKQQASERYQNEMNHCQAQRARARLCHRTWILQYCPFHFINARLCSYAHGYQLCSILCLHNVRLPNEYVYYFTQSILKMRILHQDGTNRHSNECKHTLLSDELFFCRGHFQPIHALNFPYPQFCLVFSPETSHVFVHPTSTRS